MQNIYILCLLLLSNSLLGQISFTADEQNMFSGISDGDLSLADVDGDDDLDLFVIGYPGSFQAVSELYLNDGQGVFELSLDTFPGLGYSGMRFHDIDGDNDQDIFMYGQGIGQDYTHVYLNDGLGDFSLLENTPFPGLSRGYVSFGDVDNDGDDDVMIQGISNLFTTVTKLYINEGDAVFVESLENTFTSAYQGESDFADIDSDGDQDLVLVGSLPDGSGKSTLYINDGDGIFTVDEDATLEGLNSSTVDFADIDNDGDQDLLLTGYGSNGITTKMYNNNGQGLFNEITNSSIADITFGACSFGDLDNDGDLDLLYAGRQGAIPDETTKVYLNNGNGQFSQLTNSYFIGATAGGVDIGDINGDGDLDLVVAGVAPDGEFYTSLYLNQLILSSTDETLDNSFEVSPNPFENFLTLQLSDYNMYSRYEIRNIAGHLVDKGRCDDMPSLTIPTHYLSSGIYVLSLQDKNGAATTLKLVKR